MKNQLSPFYIYILAFDRNRLDAVNIEDGLSDSTSHKPENKIQQLDIINDIETYSRRARYKREEVMKNG